MQLVRFREAQGLTLQQMTERVNAHLPGTTTLHLSTVGRHERGVTEPSVEQIEAYRKATEGAVTFDDWVDLANRVRAAKVPPPAEGEERAQPIARRA